MEIKVGDYIRTKAGYIGEVININDFRDPGTKICVDFNLSDYIFIGEKDIKKHSQNIIDLVEIGDYVNKYKVLDIMEDMNTGEIHLKMISSYTNKEKGDCTIYDNDIKTILTHELYEANCYKVGGKKKC